MKFPALLASLVTLTISLSPLAHAQETPSQATLTAVTGQAKVKLPDGTSAPATVGMKVAQGAVIATEDGARVSILVHDGIVAVLAGNSVVEVEKLSVNANGTRNAMLNLKTGNLASSLDPARKSENNYGVRTAKGVAMAHGTDLTVTVNGNVYLVAVLNGTVQVTWSGGQSVSISGGTANAVATNNNGVTTSGTLGAAMAAGGSAGLTDALTAAAAAVATLATNSAQVTALINTIAAAAGTSSTASTTVASITAAATGAALTNSTLVAAGGGTTNLASTISTAAVTAATAAGNGSAAQLIVTSAVNAVANTIPGTNVNQVATALASASNNVPGSTNVQAGLVTAGVNAAQNPSTAQLGSAGQGKGKTEATTPITPVDPSINVSRSS